MNLKEKYGSWALITGASSGIGEAFAYRLAKENINLVLVARRKERLENLKILFEKEYKIEVVAAVLDLTADSIIEEIKEYVGNREISILINNAGFGSNGEFVNADLKHESDMVKLNCLAPTILTHYFVNSMIERRKGAIIFLGSLLAFLPTPMAATYSATKAFNSFLGDSLWYELKKYNIDVLSLNPGGTDTEFSRISVKRKGPAPRKPLQVVDTALNSLGKKPSVVDGFYNKLFVLFAKYIPRKVLVNLVGTVANSLHSQKKS